MLQTFDFYIPKFQVSGDSERIVDIDANPWYVQLGTGPLDNYGNIVTNISKKFFYEFSKGRSFSINARNITFNEIFNKYSEAINFTKEKKYREEDGKKIV